MLKWMLIGQIEFLIILKETGSKEVNMGKLKGNPRGLYCEYGTDKDNIILRTESTRFGVQYFELFND